MTRNPVEPVMLPDVALTVPAPMPSGEKLPVAEMLPSDRPAVIAQWQVSVRFCVLPSEYVPVAVNCTLLPSRLMMVGLAGVTAIDCSTALVTVMASDPVTPFSVARALKLPVATPVADPAALTTPTEGVAEDHPTWLVRFCVELSL
jgi:hypothetical protein